MYAAFITNSRMLSRIQNRSHTDLGWRFGDIYPNFVTITGTCFVFACRWPRSRAPCIQLPPTAALPPSEAHARCNETAQPRYIAPEKKLPKPAEVNGLPNWVVR